MKQVLIILGVILGLFISVWSTDFSPNYEDMNGLTYLGMAMFIGFAFEAGTGVFTYIYRKFW